MRRHLVQSVWKFVPQHQADELLPGRRVPGCLGAGALGKSWKMFHFWDICFWTFCKLSKKNETIDEICRMCSDWGLIDPERIPASSFRLPSFFLPIFPRNRGKMKKNRIFSKVQIFRVFPENPETNGPPPYWIFEFTGATRRKIEDSKPCRNRFKLEAGDGRPSHSWIAQKFQIDCDDRSLLAQVAFGRRPCRETRQ